AWVPGEDRPADPFPRGPVPGPRHGPPPHGAVPLRDRRADDVLRPPVREPAGDRRAGTALREPPVPFTVPFAVTRTAGYLPAKGSSPPGQDEVRPEEGTGGDSRGVRRLRAGAGRAAPLQEHGDAADRHERPGRQPFPGGGDVPAVRPGGGPPLVRPRSGQEGDDEKV